MSTKTNLAGSRVLPASNDSKESQGLPSSSSAPVGNLAGAVDNATGKRDRTGESYTGAPHSWEAAERKLEEQLLAIRSNLVKMKARTNVQKNVSRVITDGMGEIEESVEVAMYELQRMRQLRQLTVTEEQRTGEGLATPRVKRKAGRQTPSPEPGTSDKQEDPGKETWATATKRKKRKATAEPETDANGTARTGTKWPKARRTDRPDLKPRRGAILIKPAQGKTYADILRYMRQNVNPTDNQVDIRAIRRTKDGSVLLQLEQEQERQIFQKKLQDALGQTATVKDMTSRVTLEFMDLDCVTTAEDVAAAINRETGTETERNVHVFGVNNRGQALAVCEFDATEATDLLKKGRIKIGWVNCRIRPRLRVPRCFKCLGYGHVRNDCTGPDRRDCCWKCGQKGHMGKACLNTPSCFLCTRIANQDLAHVPGTSSCAVFKAALTEGKTRQSRWT